MHKNKKALRQTEDFVKMFKDVLHVFADIQEASVLNKSHVMQLVKLHKQNAFFFDKALEQAYIKIFKCFHERANKKIPTKFQTVADLFFKEILKEQSEQGITSFNQFCDLLSEAIFSSIMNVRVMASRMMFLVLKNLPSIRSINVLLNEKTQNTVAKAVLFLVKQKVSTYRQLGIKLSSLVLYCKSQSQSSIQNQLFKILSTEENQMIRKMVMTNIPIHQGTIDRILVRLRDKNSEIRATLLRRLLTENYRLQSLKLNNIYKILYDGYGTKDIICKEQALRYFASYFKEGDMEIENKFQNFIELFQPNLLLVNSHLYILFNKLLGELLAFLPAAVMCQYVRKLCIKVKSLLKDKNVDISNELIWLKNASHIKPQIKQINTTFEEYSPSGTQLAELLKFFLQRKNIFAINEFLQMFTNIKMPDQIGKNRMYDTLRETLRKLTFFELKLNLNEVNKQDDICNVQTKQQIHLKKFMLSYYDIQIISNSMDLIYPIVSAMRYLRPESFIHEIQQTISDFQNPDEYPAFKEKSTIQLTLNSLLNNSEQNSQKNRDKISYLKEKLNKIEEEIQFLNYKTVIGVTAVSKIQHDWNLDAYMPLIKEQISRNDQSNGIYLLGLYCLGDVQKVNSFFPIFWHNIMEDAPKISHQTEEYQQYKLKLMISMKIMTDFIVKFNILNSQGVMNSTSTDQSTNYNSDAFMQKITHLILDKDTDIRIFSIECLCRMIYHNRVDQNNISTYFLYLLLLWWETGNDEVSAKSVHTISLFFRSYIDKGNEQVKKLAQMLCIFHKILKIFEEKNKTINKKLIVYNLKINEFIKRTVSVATNVLKYHKEKKTMWTYQEPQLGPQEFFLLYLLYEPGFQNILQKPVNTCDFYTKQCPLETLIFVKKKLERFVELVHEDEFYPSSYRFDKTVTKKSLEEINRFEKEIETHIQVKDEETFNEEIINTLERIFSESCKYVNEQAKRIAKNIEEEQIFINIDSDMEEESNNSEISSSSEGQSSDDEGDEDDIKSMTSSVSVSHSSHKMKMQEPRMLSRREKQQKKKMNNAQRKRPIIEEKESEHQNSPLDNESDSSSLKIKAKTVEKNNRKRAPVERNLSARQQIARPEGSSSEQPVRRTTRARKPIL